MKIYVLDGKDMTSRQTAYRVIERTMDMPDYFGKNLDALADCLGERTADMSVVFVNTDALKNTLGDYADKMLNVFREASRDVGFRFLEKA